MFSRGISFLIPNKETRVVQGYEPFALDILINDYQEHDIITFRKDIPVLWWHDAANKRHRHYVDIYIASINKCIEVKSDWTILLQPDRILINKKELVEKHI